MFPTNDQRIEFEESGIKDVIQGSGDSKALMLILSAELQISSVIGPIQRNDSSAGDLNKPGPLLLVMGNGFLESATHIYY